MEDNPSVDQGGGDGLGMIQVHYTYCTLYFCYFISSTSDHQALDPRGWGPLDCKIPSRKQSLSKQIHKATKKYVHCYQRLPHGGGIMDGFYNLLRLIWMLLIFIIKKHYFNTHKTCGDVTLPERQCSHSWDWWENVPLSNLPCLLIFLPQLLHLIATWLPGPHRPSLLKVLEISRNICTLNIKQRNKFLKQRIGQSSYNVCITSQIFLRKKIASQFQMLTWLANVWNNKTAA